MSVVVLALSTALSAEAGNLTFCNQTPLDARVAVASRTPNATVVEGWLRLRPGDCKSRLMLPDSSNVRTYAESTAKSWGGDGGQGLCVEERDFSGDGSGSCAAPRRTVQFKSQPEGYRGTVLTDERWSAITSLEEARIAGVQSMLLENKIAKVVVNGRLDEATRAALANLSIQAQGTTLSTDVWKALDSRVAKGATPAISEPGGASVVGTSPAAAVNAPTAKATQNSPSVSSDGRQVKVCNFTSSVTGSAFGYLSPGSETNWIARGWTVSEPGDCATVSLPNSSGAVYVLSRGFWLQSDQKSNPLATEFCVDMKDSFELPAVRATECQAKGGEIAWFTPATITDGVLALREAQGVGWGAVEARRAAEQRMLTALNLYSGAIDGNESADLAKAIDLFRNARSQPKLTGKQLQAELRAAVKRKENYAYLLNARPGSVAEPPSPPADVSSHCATDPIKYPATGSSTSYKYPSLSDKVINDYFNEFLSAREPAHVASLSRAFRECLGTTLVKVRENPHYILNGSYDTSALMLEGPRLLMLQALSFLYAPNRADQDPLQAADMVRRAFDEYKSTTTRASAELQARYRELEQEVENARREAERRNEKSQKAALIAGVIGAVLLKKGLDAPNDVVLNSVQDMFARTMRDYDKDLEKIARMNQRADSVLTQAREVAPNQTWTDDGVRLHVVRFEGAGGAHGPAQGRHDHTRLLVRVTNTGSCTGALVGPRLVLTAQHCIKERDGQSKGPTAVRWEYFTNGPERGIVPGALSVRVTSATTASGLWADSWANDWALLELEKPLQEGMGYLVLLDPEQMPQLTTRRISLAGYSSDIDNGDFITMDWGCEPSPGPDVLRHRCKSWKGASGSPIVISDGPNKSAIVGVHAFGRSPDIREGGGPSVRQFYATWRELLASQNSK